LNIKPLKLEGTYEITVEPKRDSRGYFAQIYQESIFEKYKLQTQWKQDNIALSNKKGVLRGLHFQKQPYSQTKLIKVITGAIFDVFVDIRKDSRTFGQWDYAILSENNHKMIYIPAGFAHGYCTLTSKTIVIYKVDAFYFPEYESGIIWNDSTLKIKWPIENPVLSQKDKNLPSFNEIISHL
jgi:dTDP-4-dehydrorhamnose 3,5-epimerase